MMRRTHSDEDLSNCGGKGSREILFFFFGGGGGAFCERISTVVLKFKSILNSLGRLLGFIIVI